MLTKTALDDLLREENERVEWKESGRDEAEVLHTVCALANDLRGSGRPGFLVLGVRKDGTPVGVDTSDQAIQQLTNRLRSTAILPHPSFDVEKLARSGKELLIVQVAPSPVPPIVKVRSVAWVRQGTSTRRASDADLARLGERRSEALWPFDLRPCRAATLEDLNLNSLRETYAAEHDIDPSPDTFPAFENWMGQGDILRRVEASWVPTVAGVLVYGIEPRRLVPGAFVEFARYAGEDFDSTVVTRKTVTGPLPDQMEALWAQLKIQVAEVPLATEGLRSPYLPEYPLDALRELIRNLIQHRLYEGTNAPARVSWLEDRIVFSNPGSRFGRASEGEFGEHSDYRNPTITRLLVELGYVERLGRGISLVRALLRKNGNPDLEVESDGFVTVTARKRT